MSADPEVVFWPGSLGARGFTATLVAARAGRFSAVAMSPQMIQELLDSGHDGASIQDEAAGYGVRLTELDGASSWAPVWYGNEMSPQLRARFDYPPTRILDLAETVGMNAILAAGAFDPGAVPIDELTESFGTFCDAAADRGMRVELEFVPFWGIPNLEMAWRVVSQANRRNSGLMIDTWHLLKGSANPAAGLAVLNTIPGEKLTGLQLADALITPQADTLYGEGRFRRFPGDGELNLKRVASLMLQKGGLRDVGAEVFGQAIDDLTTEVAGARAAASTRQILDEAGSELRR